MKPPRFVPAVPRRPRWFATGAGHVPAASAPAGEGAGAGTIRRMLLALMLFGIIGLGIELILLEHTESVWQWVPFVILGAGLASGVAVAVRPTRRTVRTFRAVMVLTVGVGLLGVYLHYRGNAEFELEMDPVTRGLDLFWNSLRGATPALAPGALVQLGLLGLLYTYRHPAMRGRTTAPLGGATSEHDP